jgi:hypothetical protein
MASHHVPETRSTIEETLSISVVKACSLAADPDMSLLDQRIIMQRMNHVFKIATAVIGLGHPETVPIAIF